MDFNKLSNISMWDVRSAINKVKNVVLNYTEMESKIDEACGPEPWGASSTVMKEIAEGTYDYQLFNEIMPAIYEKFSDCDPSSWRKVYKALQLIEYLIKNGSEKVIDDVRGHITIIKMLRNFHYVDSDGKDHGINVKIRAKELLELLQDKDRIYAERQKAKESRSKYISIGSGGASETSISYNRNMDSLGSSAYGSQSGGGGHSDSISWNQSSGRGSAGLSSGRNKSASSAYYNDFYQNNVSAQASERPRKSTKDAAASKSLKAKSRVADEKPKPPTGPKTGELFSFDDDDLSAAIESNATPPSITQRSTTSSAVVDLLGAPSVLDASGPDNNETLAMNNGNSEDEWGDFQTVETTPVSNGAQPQISNGQKKANGPVSSGINFMDISSDSSMAAIQPTSQQQPLNPEPYAIKQGVQISSASRSPTNSAHQVTSSSSTSSNQKLPGVKDNDIWALNSSLISLDSLNLSEGKKSDKTKAKPTMNQLTSQGRI